MLIDLFTVAAQIVNFLILMLLLRRFLYRPILNAMEERERKVVERLEEAERHLPQPAAGFDHQRAAGDHLGVRGVGGKLKICAAAHLRPFL